MKLISTPLLSAVSAMLLLFSACNNNSRYTVKGVVSGADGQTMYFENVGVSSVEIIDSVKLSTSGKFKISHPRPEYPDFFRLRLNKQLINVAIDSTETITIGADAGTFATSYTIEGSENILNKTRNLLGKFEDRAYISCTRNFLLRLVEQLEQLTASRK